MQGKCCSRWRRKARFGGKSEERDGKGLAVLTMCVSFSVQKKSSRWSLMVGFSVGEERAVGARAEGG